MIRPVMRDPLFLSRKSTPATQEDLPVAQDLLETLRANSDRCVGMAANMIGVSKRIIAVLSGPITLVMLNPVILRKEGPYQTEEGCLSLDGVRPVQRFQTIEVTYQDLSMRPQKGTFQGWIAQIIQHEVDHCDGILI